MYFFNSLLESAMRIFWIMKSFKMLSFHWFLKQIRPHIEDAKLVINKKQLDEKINYRNLDPSALTLNRFGSHQNISHELRLSKDLLMNLKKHKEWFINWHLKLLFGYRIISSKYKQHYCDIYAPICWVDLSYNSTFTWFEFGSKLRKKYKVAF